jgi:hypothetical protein
VRWAGDDTDLPRRYAEELVALAPDVLLASGNLSVAAFQRVTRTVPIVFVNVFDPVRTGFVSNLARPGGNTTGFSSFELYSTSEKLFELLKKLAPQTTRIAVLRDPSASASIGQFAAIQSAVSSSGIELSVIDPRDANEIERGLATFGREPNGGSRRRQPFNVRNQGFASGVGIVSFGSPRIKPPLSQNSFRESVHTWSSCLLLATGRKDVILCHDQSTALAG